MDNIVFIIWIVITCVFSIIELFSKRFICMFVSVAAALTALSEALGAQIWLQILIFVVLTAALIYLVRPKVLKLTGESDDNSPKVGGRVLAHCGVVIEEIDAETHIGRVRIQKEEWRAEAPGYGAIPVGKSVEIVKVEGAHVIVKPTKSICGSCTACREPELSH
jgi:membrane protein implicated in regulation of membrane protease activity